MISIIIDLAICLWATAYASMHWNDPTAQYYVGVNFVLAFWCFSDLLKAFAAHNLTK